MAPESGANTPEATESGSGSATQSGSRESASSGSSVARSSAQLQPVPASRVTTRLQKGIKNPKIRTDGTIRYGMLCVAGEPTRLKDALGDSRWKNAMDEEYSALMKNKMWHLVPER